MRINGKTVLVGSLSLSQCVNVYLMTSYQYYIRFSSLIDDTEFDVIAKRLYDEFESIEHPHKYLLEKDALRAGTAYQLKRDDYPTVVTVASDMWARDLFTEAHCNDDDI